MQGDPLQLRTLVNNLVRNALRYCPAGARVDVMAEMHGGVPTLRVIDNGPGIDPAEIGAIFAPSPNDTAPRWTAPGRGWIGTRRPGEFRCPP
ncbi:sensor histidine kinase [Variovorax sp. GT1P44]|uniref:sensor histidine kinase n=1 Tax=Variovorax sp. GT1P44 TaxID=3443742 RepID=UPI003F4865F9